MRTTVEIADSLMSDIREIMRLRGTTLKALVDAGLRRVVESESRRREVELPEAAFRGPTGFAEGVDASDLPRLIEDTLHSGRAGS